jgi:hypothetical protein
MMTSSSLILECRGSRKGNSPVITLSRSLEKLQAVAYSLMLTGECTEPVYLLDDNRGVSSG